MHDVEIEMTAPGVRASWVVRGEDGARFGLFDDGGRGETVRRRGRGDVFNARRRRARDGDSRGGGRVYFQIERRFAEAHAEISYGSDRFAFKEIGSRGGGERFDALVDLEREEWASLRALANMDAPWLPFVRELMSDSWNVNVSVVYSKPGAKNQEWHADGRTRDAECDPGLDSDARLRTACAFSCL